MSNITNPNWLDSQLKIPKKGWNREDLWQALIYIKAKARIFENQTEYIEARFDIIRNYNKPVTIIFELSFFKRKNDDSMALVLKNTIKKEMISQNGRFFSSKHDSEWYQKYQKKSCLAKNARYLCKILRYPLAN